MPTKKTKSSPEANPKAVPGTKPRGGAGTNPGAALKGLLSILDLETLEHNLFRGRSPQEGWQRVYGGQVLGQALVAAVRTVEVPHQAHSLHGYFMLAGDPAVPIIYSVDRLRDGKSFSTRRVTALQHGRAIFAMSVSFHCAESSFDHQAEMPDVPPPQNLPSIHEIKDSFVDRLPDTIRSFWQREWPIEMRPVDMSRYLSREKRNTGQQIWMRANGSLPDEPSLHQCVLAYASDFSLLDTGLIPHGKTLFDSDLQLASLDHALWFHRPFRADEWLLYAQDSPSAHGARGFCRGAMFSLSGELVASTAQEGLMRRRDKNFKAK